VYLDNLREIGASHMARVLVFSPRGRKVDPWFKRVESTFSEVKFFYYEDSTGVVGGDIRRTEGYIPLLRPYMLAKHFREYPELSSLPLLYTDSDILFLHPLDFLSPFLEDDINYISYTGNRNPGGNYLNSEYFDSKVKDVLPDKLEKYKIIDVLGGVAELMGVSRTICEENNQNTGGAQYLLKNIDDTFWGDVYEGCCKIRLYLRGINKEYFSSEDKGFQSFCSDMWSVLYNLWKRGATTQCPKEMDFCWATDKREKLQDAHIYHNAGITAEDAIKEGDITIPSFYKGHPKYRDNIITPFEDPYVEEVATSPLSKKYCTSYYAEKITHIKQKYRL